MPISEIGDISLLPSISTVPALIGSSPVTSSIVVLLPQPDGPMMLTNSPGLMSRSIGPSA